MLKDFIDDLKREFKGYSGQKLKQDMLAGLTVTAVALPGPGLWRRQRGHCSGRFDNSHPFRLYNRGLSGASTRSPAPPAP